MRVNVVYYNSRYYNLDWLFHDQLPDFYMMQQLLEIKFGKQPDVPFLIERGELYFGALKSSSCHIDRTAVLHNYMILQHVFFQLSDSVRCIPCGVRNNIDYSSPQPYRLK